MHRLLHVTFLFVIGLFASPIDKTQLNNSSKVTEEKADPVYLETVQVNVELKGNIASTTVTMTFRNPGDRVLESNLTFPMPDGVSINRFALDFNGKMREAVPVEKTRATEVFEDIEQRQVDPALLEKVEGNSFRTRIYPIPARGTRTILLGYDQELQYSDTGLNYHLPFNYSIPVPNFSLRIIAFNSDKKPEVTGTFPGKLNFKKTGPNFEATLHKPDFLPGESLDVSIHKSSKENDVLVQQSADKYYFLANTTLKPQRRLHHWKNKLGIIWDLSLNSRSRDIKKELDLLDEVIRQKQDLLVVLAFLNNTCSHTGSFFIKNGNWSKLRKYLESATYDGGTDYSTIKDSVLNADEYLFFSDGLSGFGKTKVVLSKPVYCINSLIKADFSNLKYIAASTGGKFINLNTMSLAEAATRLNSDHLQFIGIKHDQNISEVYPSLPEEVRSHFSFSGVSVSASSKVILQFGFGKEVLLEKEVELRQKDSGDLTPDIKKIYAAKKLAELELNQKDNKEAILNLGKEFGIVTRNTSLIVLETAADYVRYDISPPEELRSEFVRLKKKGLAEKEERKEDLLDDAILTAGELREWWNKEFKPKPEIKLKNRILQGDPIAEMEDRVVFAEGPVVTAAIVAPVRGVAVSQSEAKLSEFVSVREPGSEVKALNQAGRIIIPDFKSDKDYMLRIKGQPAEAYKTYLSLRDKYISTPLFYLDIANWFFNQQESDTALKILSNLTELELEDAALYKVLAYNLKQRGYYTQQVFITGKIIEWRPMEAQSYRDHALALQDAGKYQEALDMLYSVLTRSYTNQISDRDEGIEEIILPEMNQLINQLIKHSQDRLLIKDIKNELKQALPVDIRVVLNWNKNNTDIDLWITDPRKERTFYSNPLSQIGGRISNDFTNGYGPEQFLLKKAVKGKYKIELNYYGDTQLSISGPTTVMAEIYTHYGTARQQRKIITLQMAREEKEGVLVGEFVF